MITSRQRRPVPATMIPTSRHRFRLQRPESVCVTHRHWWWHVEVEPCTASLPSPGRPQDASGPSCRPPGLLAHNALVIFLSAAQAS
jgi:hypothetical protein